jgi:iron donor protein CyaY
MRRPTLSFRAERPGLFLRPFSGRRVAQLRNLSSMYDSFSALVALDKSLVYAQTMLDEKDFQKKADAAFDDLKRRLLTLGDEHGFDVEGESGKLEVIFEEPEEAKFVVSPNTPVREIWISALSTSFKLSWSDSKNAFILEKTGENLFDVMSRVVSQQLGTQVKL